MFNDYSDQEKVSGTEDRKIQENIVYTLHGLHKYDTNIWNHSQDMWQHVGRF